MKIGHLEFRRDGNSYLIVNTRAGINVSRYDCETPEQSLAEAVAAARKILNGDPRRKRYYLHLGLEEAMLETGELFGHHLIIDGDGWQAWGEKPYTNGNEGELRHAMIESDSLADLREIQAFLDANLNYPVDSLVSDSDVWTTLDGVDIPYRGLTV